MAPSSAEPPFEFSFRSRRDHWHTLKSLSSRPLNVLIVGGGIVGAGALRSLALRDVPDVVLIERNDFASATSGASSKLIHAGIRYLELSWNRLKKFDLRGAWQNFRFVLEASAERKILGEMAPHLIKPKPIYLILGKDDGRSALSVLTGICTYYAMQIFQGQFFSPPRVVFRKDAIRWVAPEIDPDRTKAIFSFWDSETDDARLVIENLQSAAALGARALNYVELVSYRQEGGVVIARLRDRESGEEAEVRAKILIDAAGPFIDDIRACSADETGAAPLIDRVAGAHLDVYPAITAESYYITAGDGRLIFVLRRDEDGLVYTRIGTTERPLGAAEGGEHIEPTADEIEYLRTHALAYFPKARIDGDTILRLDEGIRPLRRQEAADAFNKSREHEILRHGNVFHVIGVKLTDYRRVAIELMRKLPWTLLGVDPGLDRDDAPLREGKGPAYAEKTIDEIVNRTMAIHWDDYVSRRRGLAPRVEARFETARHETEFEAFARLMGWDAQKKDLEKRRMNRHSGMS